MPNFICTTCGTQFAETEQEPAACPICDDERQYLGPQGQQWTTLERLRRGHRNSWRKKEAGLLGLGTEPSFAIGQRALLLQRPEGNILWDCISLLDEATIELVRALGGLKALAISHPHYYTTMVEWSRAFGDIPIYLHAADRHWVMRPDERIRCWEGETLPLAEGVTLLRCGGHFAGGTVLHWAQGAEGRGALLAGDIIQVVSDLRYVSFMYSYPNMIPLPAGAVGRIAAAVAPLQFERLYGAWWGRTILSDARGVVLRSAERYQRALAGELAGLGEA